VEMEEQSRRAARARASFIICTSSFLSMCQHGVCVQTEPRLILELCKGDVGAASRLLGNTSGIVGLLSLIVNQTGGKLSDATGRKPCFFVGPAMSTILGWLVYKNSSNRGLVLVCRTLRLIFTSFSNTVMVRAALADVAAHPSDFQRAQNHVQVATGLGLLLIPFLEARLLGKGIKYVYLALSAIGAAHCLFATMCLPETLPLSHRKKPDLSFATVNPLSFIRVFTEGSKTLWQFTMITTFQMFLEGKNISDSAQNWVRDHLKWSVTGIRNFIIIYGVLCTMSSMSLAPILLRMFNAKDYTTLTNLLNIFAFSVRGIKASTALWLLAMFPMLPGVNGNCAIKLTSLAQNLAEQQGFGNGEFSAWANNLRALVGAAAPVLYGQIYASLGRKGRNPGLTFAFAGLLGAVVPQLMLMSMKESDITAAEAAAAEAAAAKKR